MSYPIKEFHYQQTGLTAMQCSGTVGSGVAILDACLVNGFGSNVVTSISVTANVATVTTSGAHGYLIGEIVAISGANETVFNSEFKILTVGSTTTFTIAVVTAFTSATGTISVKNPGLGWQKVFSGTNKAVYRSQDTSGTRLWLRVDDTNTMYMTVTMYETMTSVDVGTGASTVLYWKKSDVASAATRPWYLIGDSKRFYFLTDWDITFPLQPSVYLFGDIVTVKILDAYHCALVGHTVSAPSYPVTSLDFGSLTITATTGLILARSFTQVGSQIAFGKRSATQSGYMGYSTTSYCSYPNPSDNGLHLTPVYVFETVAKTYRGTLPGLLVPFEDTNGTFLSRDSTITISGKTYIAYRIAVYTSNTYGNLWFDLDGPWS